MTFSQKGIFTPVKKLLSKENDDDKATLLSTKTLYLPAGNYDLEFYLENQKLYKSFYLDPRVIQKQDIKSYEKRTIKFDLAETAPKQVSFTLNVFDSVTAGSIYDEAKISLYLNSEKKWIDWKKYNNNKRLTKYLKNILLSGRDYSFKFDAPDYYPKIVKFHVEKNLDSAFIEVGLIKKPGKLIIKSNYKGLELLIDNRKESYAGGVKKEFIKYGKTTAGVSEFSLPEGKYILTVKKGNSNVQNFQFRISSKQKTFVNIKYSKDEKELRVSRK